MTSALDRPDLPQARSLERRAEPASGIDPAPPSRQVVRWIEPMPSVAGAALRAFLEMQGYTIVPGPGDGTVVIVVDRPDPRWIPLQGHEALWWVRNAKPEEVSAVLNLRPGWVLRQSSPPEAAVAALDRLRQRDLGSDGWLRQMIQLATLDEFLRLVLARAVRLSGAQGGAIWMRRDDTFYQRVGDGTFPEAPLARDEASELVRRGEAWLMVPSEQLGVLRLDRPQAPPEVFLGWIRDVEAMLVNAWRLEESRALSFKDDLTVAQNRRSLEAELPRAVREAAARRESLSLLFLDVDNLKAVNTAHGHPTGSLMLQSIATEAQLLCRSHDRLYRYGGDEFCILMPRTSSAGALKLGERLLRVLQGTPLELEGLSVPISMSIGVAAFPEHADGAERLLVRADQALLAAKRQGKGRVVVAE